MNIRLANRQRTASIDRAAWLNLATWLGGRLAETQPGTAWEELSLVLVGDRLCAELNEAHLGHEGPTDVLSFSYPVIPAGGGVGRSGEVIVNVAAALREAKARGIAPATELALYCVHGVLHLAGEDDLEPAAKRRMRAREAQWVKAAARAPGLGWVTGGRHAGRMLRRR